jgi:hypothetical protein
MRKKKYPEVDARIDSLFETMIARAPRRPSVPVPVAPNCERVILQFGRLRQRWKRRESIPSTTEAFASVLKGHGVYIFGVERGYIECQSAQARIMKALGS